MINFKTVLDRSGKVRGWLCGRLAGVVRDARAGVMIFMAIGLLALATATGVGVDFARGLNFKTALQGDVDAAAIAGAAVYLNSGYQTQATAAATNYFNNSKAQLPTYVGTITPTVTVSQAAPWTVTVSANGSINSSFNGLLRSTIPVSVSATAHGPTNPNIDFYLLLDSSPSMGIAATPSGISTMVANTSAQGGCAFACHETNPTSGDVAGNPGGIDNYQLARNLNVALRIDNVAAATQSLMTTAQTTMTQNSSVYRTAIYTFDVAVNTIHTLTSDLTAAQTSAGSISMLTVYSNNKLTATNSNSDTDTNFTAAMTTINTTMPNPGRGTVASGDTPQEVLMLVTDGVEDEFVSGTRTYALDTTMCDTIKNRGIRIAALYLVYYPLPTNAWYNTYISPIQSTISPKLQACASPGLFFSVDTGGDITAAMTALFNSAVKSAYISN